ncbi:GntR family transcriptional regulator [Deinococcus sonorensis]|uniref:GntR family transcriptional regulator n=2 Tax=Deinococcus sonorensis TaxID=309891 RepID=A0AAU7U780_9DEIO
MFERPTLIRDGVYAHLREAILNGEFAPAERLGEVELTERLGVSRTPIREAIQRLTQEGLLEGLPGRGVRVRVVSAGEARDTYTVRETLDGLAASLAALAHTEQDAAQLRAALSELEAAPDDDYREQTRLDLTFHRRLTQAAHNSALNDLARDLEQRVALIKHQTRVYNQHPQTSAQHHAILAAVLARDPEAARAAAALHVRTFAGLVMGNLEAGRSDDPTTQPRRPS